MQLQGGIKRKADKKKLNEITNNWLDTLYSMWTPFDGWFFIDSTIVEKFSVLRKLALADLKFSEI